MRTVLFTELCLASVLFTGCSRARITTEIRSGGDWSRTVAITGQEHTSEVTSSIEDVFVLPKGDGWKKHAETTDVGYTATFEKAFAAGASLNGDISFKGDEGKVSLANEVSVKMVAPRRYEYRETLRWTGPPPKAMRLITPDLADVKAALPTALVTNANAQAVEARRTTLAVDLLFGPGEPLLILGLLNPDLAEHRARQRIGNALLKALEGQFGNKMTPAERREVALKLIAATFAYSKSIKPDPSAGEPVRNDPGLPPLMFIVKAPGKIISSNGEVDNLTGEVYWALFPPAASLHPVTLTAIVQMDPN